MALVRHVRRGTMLGAAVGLLLAVVAALGVATAGAADHESPAATDAAETTAPPTTVPAPDADPDAGPPVAADPGPGNDSGWSNDATRRGIDEIAHARIMAWGPTGAPGAALRAEPGPLTWRFEALGTAYEVELEPNTSLLDGLPAAQRDEILAGQSLMKGTVVGAPGSWVRVSATAEGLSGMLYDGERTLQIEPATRFGELDAPAGSASVIFEAGTLETEPIICGVTGEVLDTDPVTSEHLQELFEEAEVPIRQQAENGRLLVSLVEDQDWSGNSAAIFNAVDGIYESDLGVNLVIARTQRMTINYTGDPLQDFRAVASNEGRIGVAHLLTGRNQFGGSVIGRAYLSSVCSTYALGVSANYSAMVALVAHEIGHNVGSGHDNDLGCSSGYIMWPSLGGSGQDSFSSCSQEAIGDYLSTRDTCLFGDDPPPPTTSTTSTSTTTTAPPPPPPDDPGTIEGSVTRADGSPAGGVGVDLYEYAGNGRRGQWVAHGDTDTSGRVRFPVDPGCYVLTFIAPDGQEFTNGSRFQETRGCPESGQTVRVQAQLADPGGGQTTMVGHVDRGGTPASGVKLNLYGALADGSRGEFLGVAFTDASGDATFAVSPGCYVLVFIAPDGEQFVNGSQFQEARGCPADGVSVRRTAVLPGGVDDSSIGGRVVQGATGVAGAKVDLFVAQGDGSRGTFLGYELTDATGGFRFDVAPGCYVLTFIAPDGELFTNGRRWYQPSACVTAGEDLTGVVGTLQ